MEWYWIALITGVVAPWVLMGGRIRIGFEEGGPLGGFGAWFGMCVATIPPFFLLFWLVHLLFG